MSLPLNNKKDFANYILRRLGAPVITINVDPLVVEDRIDDAVQWYNDYHCDGSQLVYSPHQITQQDIQQQFFTVDSSIIGIVDILPLTDTQANANMFDLRYQLRLNELYDFTSASYVNFSMTMQHLRTLDIMFTGLTPIEFNRNTGQLFIQWDWGNDLVTGQYVVAECYQAISPDVYPRVWNDRWLKMYATALVKQQWGNSLKKFQGVPLPGGLVLNGQQIYDEATQEKERLEEEVIRDYSAPLRMYMN